MLIVETVSRFSTQTTPVNHAHRFRLGRSGRISSRWAVKYCRQDCRRCGRAGPSVEESREKPLVRPQGTAPLPASEGCASRRIPRAPHVLHCEPRNTRHYHRDGRPVRHQIHAGLIATGRRRGQTGAVRPQVRATDRQAAYRDRGAVDGKRQAAEAQESRQWIKTDKDKPLGAATWFSPAASFISDKFAKKDRYAARRRRSDHRRQLLQCDPRSPDRELGQRLRALVRDEHCCKFRQWAPRFWSPFIPDPRSHRLNHPRNRRAPHEFRRQFGIRLPRRSPDEGVQDAYLRRRSVGLDRHIDQTARERANPAGPQRRAGARTACLHPSRCPFDRAAMDGYAVRAEETQREPPTRRRFSGGWARSRPGIPCDTAITASETIEIATQAPSPFSADVVPAGPTRLDGDYVLVSEPVPSGRNVGRRGEDVAPGTALLPAGRVLRPQDLGLLSAIGASRIDVIRRPRVALIVTGDELLPPGEPARDFQIADANSVMIAALVARDGGDCEIDGPVPDDRSAYLAAIIIEHASRCDLLLLSGGSSAGPEDHVPSITAELGTLIAHGLALRPASPTGVALLKEGSSGSHAPETRSVACVPTTSPPAQFSAACSPNGRLALPPRDPPLSRKLSSGCWTGRLRPSPIRRRRGRTNHLERSINPLKRLTSREAVVVPLSAEGFPPGGPRRRMVL